ncbi:MAG: rhombosortase [Nevskia sp.]|nr:rhombosortase [Nevskia sp.]
MQTVSAGPISGALRDSVGIWMPQALLGLASTLLMLGGSMPRALLRYDRAAVAAGEWWRLLTGNLVHLGWWHLVLNLLSLVLLVLLCPERLTAARWLWRLLVLGGGVGLGLYFLAPQVPDYVGLSGLVYGLFALGLGRQALHRDGIAVACLVFLAARIGWELVAGTPASEAHLIGGVVVAQSHLFGVAGAALCGLLEWAFGKTSLGGVAE